jgi:hypothetical protein
MRLVLFLLFSLTLFGAIKDTEPSLTCKTCHPIIYNEYYDSMHRKASIYNDAVHKAVWDKHPLKKKEQYKCAVCHTPTDKKVLKALKTGESALPQDDKVQTQDAVSCLYCHKIKNVESHKKRNVNIMSKETKILYSARQSQKNSTDVSYKIKTSFFGLVTKKSGSPFHDIDFSNENFYNAKMCIGCHSHKENAHDFIVCKMDIDEKTKTKDNCISCHMPKVQGSFTTAVDSKTHRYHGFAGSIHKPQMLAKYVDISLKKSGDGFDIEVKNRANHQLLLHPLRVGELKVDIIRSGESIVLNSTKFMRIIGKDKKPSMPWVADSVLKDNHIKANEVRKIHFDTKLQKGDIVEVRLGHYIVNPKAGKKLGITDADMIKFTLLKKERFSIKE